MNIFCRLYGHSWTHEAVDPKIAWSTDKKQVNLDIKADGEPTFHARCLRCGERRPWGAEKEKAKTGS